MKKITEFSVNYPISVLMLVLGILLLGYISFRKLGIDLFPDLNNPRVFVEIKSGERPPEEIEIQFVDRIEALAIRQKNVTQVSSISRVGTAQITVEYTWNADMDEAFLDLQKALSNFGQNSDIDELTITQFDPNAEPVLLLGLSHPQINDMDELRKVAQNYIRNELVRLEGIAEVEISGEEEKEIVIETNDYLLEAYGLTTDALSQQIQNLNRNASGGSIVEMGRKYIIKGVSVFQTLEDIGNTILTYRDPDIQIPGLQVSSLEQNDDAVESVPVFLKDVAQISFRNKDPRSIVRLNQKRCLGLAVTKETKYNTVQAVDDVLEALKDIRKALPGYEISVIQNQADFINQAITEVEETALIGIVLAVIILFIFLRRIGTTAIISLAIPISVVATFNLMYFNNLSLNIMTLGGLALGAGMLVDNAIVVMENVFRNLETGMSVKEAAITGTAQVGGAITASTITTIIVFLPIVYLHGASGELFKDQAWTVAFSLISSLFVAFIVIPMLSSHLLKRTKKAVQSTSIKFEWYSGILTKSLEKKWWVISGAIGLVLMAIFLIPIVGSEFMPKTDSNELSIELKLPEGTELYRTESTVDNIERIVREILGDNLETIYSRIGPVTGITSNENTVFEDENTASMKIILRPNLQKTLQEVNTDISTVLSEIPDLEIQFIQDQSVLQTTLGIEAAPVVLEVKGDDLEQLESLTHQVKQKVYGIKDLYNIETTFEEGRPEIEVVIDRLRIGMFNIGIGEISSQLQDQLMGKNAGQWETEGELRDITITLPDIGVNQLDDITINSGNQKVRLDEVADIQVGSAPREINRRNQARIGKVTAHVKENRPFNHVVQEIEQKLLELDFPPDYQYEIGGEEQKRKDAFANLKFALLLSIILVYMVLASQFESLIHPFTILLTIPLAGVGAILIFFVLGRTLNIMAYIGIIMLVGIAVNDSIILVDAINQLRREGFGLREAIVEAGQRRIRPIIMTSLTTILALLPLTFGFGEGAALRAPMALAVIGGLVTSTVLTLLVIPNVYYLLDKVREVIYPSMKQQKF